MALVDLLFRPGLSTLSGSSRAQYVSLTRSKGYRLYLQTAEADPLEGADLAAYVRARLPFATALGVADSWVERLESVAPSQLGEIGDSLRRNPLIYGSVAGVSGSYSLESILPVNLAENYGTRLLGGGR